MTPEPLTTQQWRAFWATWWGWALDGMDSFIYALILLPCLTELLPASGLEATPGNIGYYGSVMMAIFLVGWGTSLAWGPVADRFGRVHTLAATILVYSVFTLSAAFVHSLQALAVLRFLAGVGIGGEWSMGGTFLSESWPESRRRWGVCLMHTGYYFGFMMAAAANYWLGSRYGWRAMFLFGGTPALLVAFIRRGVEESPVFEGGVGHVASPFLEIFSPALRVRTILNALLVLVSMIGLWAGSIYVPTALSQLALKAGYLPVEASRISSWGTWILSIGTILGCLILPILAERFGRRAALGFYFVMMTVFLYQSFGQVFYWQQGALPWFMGCLFFLGLGGASFAVYTLWVPEQYPTSCRATAMAFATSAGRFAGAWFTFTIGDLVKSYGSLGQPVALTALAFLFGLALLPFAVETRGKPLPD